MLDSSSLFQIIWLLLVFEILALSLCWIVLKRGIAPLKVLGNVASGGCLIAALWVSRNQFPDVYIVWLLLMSLLFHVADMLTRWQPRK